MVAVLTEAELRRCARIDAAAVDTIADAFAALERGAAIMPPVLSMDLSEINAEVDIKTAWIRGFDAFAIKISSGFFDNAKLGLPSLAGMMALLDAQTGRVSAVCLDNGWLTDLRTAVAGAVAARSLAREDARDAAILGTGLQARLQLEALLLVRPIERAWIWGRDTAKANACAEDCRERLGIDVRALEDAADAASRADIVVTTTAARTPILDADALHPGVHVTAMGSDAPEKNELAPRLLQSAGLLVCDRQSQCERLGELHHAQAAGAIAAGTPLPELGAVITGAHPGRTSDEQTTVCDLTGTGAQDTAIAVRARDAARADGLGTMIEN